MGGGSKAVRNFSENSSVLEWGGFPYSQCSLGCGWSWVQRGPLEHSCIADLSNFAQKVCDLEFNAPVSRYDGFPWRSDKLVLNILQLMNGLGFSEHHCGVPIRLEMETLEEPKSTSQVIWGSWYFQVRPGHFQARSGLTCFSAKDSVSWSCVLIFSLRIDSGMVPGRK